MFGEPEMTGKQELDENSVVYLFSITSRDYKAIGTDTGRIPCMLCSTPS